jgi:uncharacterized membrane protein
MKTVLEMAREAEIHVYPEFEKAFERFANLIRADERDACARDADWCIQNHLEHLIPERIRARIKA